MIKNIWEGIKIFGIVFLIVVAAFALIIGVLNPITAYVINKSDNISPECRRDIDHWFKTVNPESYRKYEFQACGRTWVYYKSKGYQLYTKDNRSK